MEDKTASAILSLGCLGLLTTLAVITGGLIGIIIAVAKWIAS